VKGRKGGEKLVLFLSFSMARGRKKKGRKKENFKGTGGGKKMGEGGGGGGVFLSPFNQ